MNTILRFFAIKYNGDWDKIYKALDTKEKVPIEDLERIQNEFESKGWKTITIIDTNYPEKLKQAYKPPFVIWYYGDIKLVNNKLVNIIGNKIDEEVLGQIKNEVPNIEKEYTLLSTDRPGVEQLVKKESKKGIVYIVASGIDQVDKSITIDRNNLFISEYPMGTKFSDKIVNSNLRIQAAFIDKLLILESNKEDELKANLIQNVQIGNDIFSFESKKKKGVNADILKGIAHEYESIESFKKLEKEKDVTREH